MSRAASTPKPKDADQKSRLGVEVSIGERADSLLLKQNLHPHLCRMMPIDQYSTMNVPKIKLNNGMEIPHIGLGTWLSAKGEVGEAIKHAIDLGYRHIDCAMLYGNEAEIGEAIRSKIADGSVKREELFIVTKLWNTFHEYEQVVATCKKSLENFGLDYLDLYLMHWPVAQKLVKDFNVELPFDCAIAFDYDYVDTWRGLEDCVALGLTKSIGVSNFNSKQIARLLNSCSIKPVMNQIEVHPNLNQKKLIKFCRERQIDITAYSPFGSPARPWQKPGDPVLSFDHPELIKIAERHAKNTAQVILRYIVQLGCIPIPKSTNQQRLKDNLTIFDFELTESDMKVLDTFNCNGRAVGAVELKGMMHYPFDEEF